jgi:hypothetical protein
MIHPDDEETRGTRPVFRSYPVLDRAGMGRSSDLRAFSSSPFGHGASDTLTADFDSPHVLAVPL